MSPIDQSREIVEYLGESELIRMYLHTAICHGLTSEEINKLYCEIHKHQENTEKTN